MSDCQQTYHLSRIGPPATKPGVADVMDFDKVTTLIGRNKIQVDFVLDSANHVASQYISRLHARVVRQENNSHRLFDDSLNGVFINNTKIIGSVVLQEGDVITFGHPCGVRLKPGVRTRQPDSEYQFIFEKCRCQSSRNNVTSKPAVLEDRVNTHRVMFKKPLAGVEKPSKVSKDDKIFPALHQNETVSTSILHNIDQCSSSKLLGQLEEHTKRSDLKVRAKHPDDQTSTLQDKLNAAPETPNLDHSDNIDAISTSTSVLVERNEVLNRCMTTMSEVPLDIPKDDLVLEQKDMSESPASGFNTNDGTVEFTSHQDSLNAEKEEVTLNETKFNITTYLPSNLFDDVDGGYETGLNHHLNTDEADGLLVDRDTISPQVSISPIEHTSTSLDSVNKSEAVPHSGYQLSSNLLSSSSSIFSLSSSNTLLTTDSTISSTALSTQPVNSPSSHPTSISNLSSTTSITQSPSSLLFSFSSSSSSSISSSPFQSNSSSLSSPGIKPVSFELSSRSREILKGFHQEVLIRSHSVSIQSAHPFTPATLHAIQSTKIDEGTGKSIIAIDKQQNKPTEDTTMEFTNSSTTKSGSDMISERHVDNLNTPSTSGKSCSVSSVKTTINEKCTQTKKKKGGRKRKSQASTSAAACPVSEGRVTRGRTRKQRKVCPCCDNSISSKSVTKSPDMNSHSNLGTNQKSSGWSTQNSLDARDEIIPTCTSGDTDVVYLLSESNGVIYISDDEEKTSLVGGVNQVDHDEIVRTVEDNTTCIEINDSPSANNGIIPTHTDMSSMHINVVSPNTVVPPNIDIIVPTHSLVPTNSIDQPTNADLMLKNANLIPPNIDVFLTHTDIVQANNDILPTNPDSGIQDIEARHPSRKELNTDLSNEQCGVEQSNSMVSYDQSVSRINFDLRNELGEASKDTAKTPVLEGIDSENEMVGKIEVTNERRIEDKKPNSNKTSQGSGAVVNSECISPKLENAPGVSAFDGESHIGNRGNSVTTVTNRTLVKTALDDDIKHLVAIGFNVVTKVEALSPYDSHGVVVNNIEPKLEVKQEIPLHNDNGSNANETENYPAFAKAFVGVVAKTENENHNSHDENIKENHSRIVKHALQDDVTTPIQNDEVTTPIQNDDVTTPIQDDDVTFPIQDDEVTTPIQNDDVTTPIQNDDVTTPIQNDDVTTPIQDDDVTFPIQDDDVTTPIQNDDVTTPIQNDDVTTPIQNDDVTTPIQNDDVTTPIQDDDVTTPIQDDYVTTPIVDDDVTFPIQDDEVTTPIQNDDVTTPIQNDDVTTPIQDDDVTTPIQDDDVTTPIQDDDVTTPIQDDDVTTPIQDDDVTTPIQDDDVTTPIQDDDVTTPIQDDDVTTPIQDDDVTTPIQDDDVTTPIQDDDVTTPIQDDDVTTPIQDDDVTTPIQDDDVTTPIQDDDVTTPIQDDDVTTPIQDDDVTTPIQDDDVTTPIQDDDVTTPIQDDDVTTPIQDDDVTTPIQDDDVTTPIQDDDVTTPIQDDDVTTPIQDDDVTTPIQDDDVTTPIQDDDVTTPIQDDYVTSPIQDDDVTTPIQDDVTTQQNDDVTAVMQDVNVTIPLKDDISNQFENKSPVKGNPKISEDGIVPISKLNDSFITSTPNEPHQNKMFGILSGHPVISLIEDSPSLTADLINEVTVLESGVINITKEKTNTEESDICRYENSIMKNNEIESLANSTGTAYSNLMSNETKYPSMQSDGDCVTSDCNRSSLDSTKYLTNYKSSEETGENNAATAESPIFGLGPNRVELKRSELGNVQSESEDSETDIIPDTQNGFETERTAFGSPEMWDEVGEKRLKLKVKTPIRLGEGTRIKTIESKSEELDDLELEPIEKVDVAGVCENELPILKCDENLKDFDIEKPRNVSVEVEQSGNNDCEMSDLGEVKSKNISVSHECGLENEKEHEVFNSKSQELAVNNEPQHLIDSESQEFDVENEEPQNLIDSESQEFDVENEPQQLIGPESQEFDVENGEPQNLINSESQECDVENVEPHNLIESESQEFDVENEGSADDEVDVLDICASNSVRGENDDNNDIGVVETRYGPKNELALKNCVFEISEDLPTYGIELEEYKDHGSKEPVTHNSHGQDGGTVGLETGCVLDRNIIQEVLAAEEGASEERDTEETNEDGESQEVELDDTDSDISETEAHIETQEVLISEIDEADTQDVTVEDRKIQDSKSEIQESGLLAVAAHGNEVEDSKGQDIEANEFELEIEDAESEESESDEQNKQIWFDETQDPDVNGMETQEVEVEDTELEESEAELGDPQVLEADTQYVGLGTEMKEAGEGDKEENNTSASNVILQDGETKDPEVDCGNLRNSLTENVLLSPVGELKEKNILRGPVSDNVKSVKDIADPNFVTVNENVGNSDKNLIHDLSKIEEIVSPNRPFPASPGKVSNTLNNDDPVRSIFKLPSSVSPSSNEKYKVENNIDSITYKSTKLGDIVFREEVIGADCPGVRSLASSSSSQASDFKSDEDLCLHWSLTDSSSSNCGGHCVSVEDDKESSHFDGGQNGVMECKLKCHPPGVMEKEKSNSVNVDSESERNESNKAHSNDHDDHCGTVDTVINKDEEISDDDGDDKFDEKRFDGHKDDRIDCFHKIEIEENVNQKSFDEDKISHGDFIDSRNSFVNNYVERNPHHENVESRTKVIGNIISTGKTFSGITDEMATGGDQNKVGIKSCGENKRQHGDICVDERDSPTEKKAKLQFEFKLKDASLSNQQIRPLVVSFSDDEEESDLNIFSALNLAPLSPSSPGMKRKLSQSIPAPPSEETNGAVDKKQDSSPKRSKLCDIDSVGVVSWTPIPPPFTDLSLSKSSSSMNLDDINEQSPTLSPVIQNQSLPSKNNGNISTSYCSDSEEKENLSNDIKPNENSADVFSISNQAHVLAQHTMECYGLTTVTETNAKTRIESCTQESSTEAESSSSHAFTELINSPPTKPTTSSEIEDTIDVPITFEERRKKREKLHAAVVLELQRMNKDIKTFLSKDKPNLDQAVCVLEDLEDVPVNSSILSKFPSILDTLNKCRKYKQSDEVRQMSQEIYLKFKSLLLLP